MIPPTTQQNWARAGPGLVSFMRSGTIETSAMLRNPPAVKGRIYMRSVSNPWLVSHARASRAPIRPTRAVDIWALAASHLSNPDLRRIAKSPNSCGISCKRIAAVVVTPSLKLDRKDVPTARPWSRLSVQFASRFRYPTIFLFFFPQHLFQDC